MPAPLPGKIARITVVGNAHIPTADILAPLNQKITRPLDAVGTDAAALVNVAAVQEMGLFQSVKATTSPDPAGGVDVTCTVVENPVVRAIEITANTPDGKPTVPADTLIARMHVVGQVLNTKTLIADINALFDKSTGFFRSQGYFADVSKDINIDPKNGVLTIPLIEDYVDTITFQGSGSVPTADILVALGIKPGDLLNSDAVQAGLRRIAQTHRFAEVGSIQFTQTQPGKIACTIPVRLPRPAFGTFATGPQKSAAIDYGGPVGGFVIVPVRVNDRATGHFLLVTSTDLSEISTSFAVGLEMTPQAMLVDNQPYFVGAQEAASVVLDRLTIGGPSGIDIRNLSLPVVDLAMLSKQVGQTIDGILGADLLSRLTVGIDFPRRRVIFWNHGPLTDAERSAAGFGGGTAMPLTPAFGTLPMLAVEAQIQNGLQTKAASLIVATGNSTCLLSAADFQALGIKTIPHADNPEAVVGRATRLRFGGLSEGSPLFQRDAVNDSAALGLNVLGGYRVLLDGPARTARFTPEVTVTGSDMRRPSWVVPFQFDHLTTPLPIVQVSIDGHPPLPFLFDTGTTPALTIDREAARTLGLTVDKLPAGMMNKSISLQSTPVATAVLQGDTPADNVTVSLEQAAVLDLSATREAVIGPHLAGIIGSGMLQNLSVRFDFQKRLLTFTPVPDASLEQADMPSAPGTSLLPLSEGISDGLYFAAFTPVSGPPVQMLVDSGSDSTILPYEMRAALLPLRSTIDVHWMFGSMWLGQNLLLSRPPYAGMPTGELSVSVEMMGDVLHQPTLGVDTLSRSVATLDIPRMQLTLAPPSKPAPSVFSGWVGTRLTQDKGRFRITQVLPASPAARAGMKAGDILLAIDGRPLQGLLLFNVRTLVDGLAGTPAAFQIRRGNRAPQTVRFRRAEISGDPPCPLNGVYGRRTATGPFRIDAVLPDCPAARAGLAAGDTLTAINGQATARLTSAQWETLLLLTRLTLTVSRDGTTRTVVLADAAPASERT